MAQIDIQNFAGVERFPLRARLSLLASMIVGEARKLQQVSTGKGGRPAAVETSRRLHGPVGREAAYLRDLDIELGF